jgi:hypothetical protein
LCIALHQSFRVTQLKTAVTVRLNPELLAEVRQSAARDNRSLTNFIETALRERIEGVTARAPRSGLGSDENDKDNKNQ